MTHSLDHRALLGFLHSALKPKLYVEIGVGAGATLCLADPALTHAVAIDPDPRLTFEPRNTTLAVATSDNFFAHEPNRERCRGFDLAFIDGAPTVDQAARDFRNLEALAGPQSVIAIHDVIPMDNECDVWRLMAALVEGRPDLTAITVACPPSGLGIVGRFGGGGVCALGDDRAPLDLDWSALAQVLRIVPNDGNAIAAAFKGAMAA